MCIHSVEDINGDQCNSCVYWFTSVFLHYTSGLRSSTLIPFLVPMWTSYTKAWIYFQFFCSTLEELPKCACQCYCTSYIIKKCVGKLIDHILQSMWSDNQCTWGYFRCIKILGPVIWLCFSLLNLRLLEAVCHIGISKIKIGSKGVCCFGIVTLLVLMMIIFFFVRMISTALVVLNLILFVLDDLVFSMLFKARLCHHKLNAGEFDGVQNCYIAYIGIPWRLITIRLLHVC